MNLLANPKVMAILKDRYGITLDSRKAGSIEMVTTLSTAGVEVLWPSNQIAVEMFKKKGGVLKGEENIFNSPIVLYTYDIVADALMEQGIVEKKSETYYIVDFPKLVDYIQEGKSWKDIAWERHGFRTGLLGVENDPAVLKVTGIPKEITAVIPMPDAGIMERIISALSR